MAQIVTKFVEANAIDDTRIRLRNAQPLRARNNANSGDINIFSVNASDRVVFPAVPQSSGTPSVGADLITKTYADATYEAASVWNKEDLTLNGTDITNQYKDLAFTIVDFSLSLSVSGVLQTEGVDYTLSVVSSVTRITFAGDLATGGPAALISGDVLHAQYQH